MGHNGLCQAYYLDTEARWALPDHSHQKSCPFKSDIPSPPHQQPGSWCDYSTHRKPSATGETHHPRHTRKRKPAFTMPETAPADTQSNALAKMFDRLCIGFGEEGDRAGDHSKPGDHQSSPAGQQRPQATEEGESGRKGPQRNFRVTTRVPSLQARQARQFQATWMRQRHAEQQRTRKRDAARRRQRADAERAGATARQRQADEARQGRRRHEEACRQHRRRVEEKDRAYRRGAEDKERAERARTADEAREVRRQEEEEDEDRAQRRQREEEDRERRRIREEEDRRQRREREEADRQQRRRWEEAERRQRRDKEEEEREWRCDEDEGRRRWGPPPGASRQQSDPFTPFGRRSHNRWDGSSDIPNEPPPGPSSFRGWGSSSQRPSNPWSGGTGTQRDRPNTSDEGGFGSPRWWREEKQREKQQQQQQQAPRPEAPPSDRRTPFETWEAECHAFLADKEHADFPHPPHTGCARPDCLRRIRDASWPLGTCWHSLQRLLQTRPGLTARAFVKKFRLHWHPDRFSAPVVGGTLKQRQAEEMFKMLADLAEHTQ